MIVRELVLVIFLAVRDQNLLSLEVDLFYGSVEETHAAEQLPDRIDDVRRIEIAGGDFVQHRREEKKVVTVHQGHLDLRIACQAFFDLEGGVKSAEAAAQDQNPLFH